MPDAPLGCVLLTGLPESEPEPVGAGVFGWSRNFHPAPASTPTLQYCTFNILFLRDLSMTMNMTMTMSDYDYDYDYDNDYDYE